MKQHFYKKTILISLTFLLVCNVHCYWRFTAEFKNRDETPIPYSLVYFETSQFNKLIDFTWLIADSNGVAHRKKKLKRKLFQRSSYVVFYSNYIPELVYDHSFRILGNGNLVFTLFPNEILVKSFYGNPNIFKQDFPFENNPKQLKKLINPKNRLLIERFADWYDSCIVYKEYFSPEKYRKMELLDSIMTELNFNRHLKLKPKDSMIYMKGSDE